MTQMYKLQYNVWWGEATRAGGGVEELTRPNVDSAEEFAAGYLRLSLAHEALGDVAAAVRYHIRSVAAASGLPSPGNTSEAGGELLVSDEEVAAYAAAAEGEALSVPWDTNRLLFGPPARLARLYLTAARPADALHLRLQHLAAAEAAGDAASSAVACRDVAAALQALGREEEASESLGKCTAHARRLQPAAAAAAAVQYAQLAWAPALLASELLPGFSGSGLGGVGPAASAALIQAAWARPDGLSYRQLNEEAR